MFKLNINKISISAHLVDSYYSLWHGRLEHVNSKTLHFISKHGLIAYSDKEEKKYGTCV